MCAKDEMYSYVLILSNNIQWIANMKITVHRIHNVTYLSYNYGF